MKQISQEKFMQFFFFAGAIIFAGVGLLNIFTNSFYWNTMILPSKISAVLTNIFNFLLAICFCYMFKGTLKEKVKTISEENIEEALGEMQ